MACALGVFGPAEHNTHPEAAMSPPPVLDIRGLCKSFGGLQVTRNVSLQLHAGERVGLIGPNGAGKTTLINLITGVLSHNEGSVVWM
jgi:branched-chain amino acid transport system ATP-binding protein